MSHNHFELLKRGDPIALEKIYKKYGSNIYWKGRQLINDHFVVETLVQDTFLKLWVLRDRIETPKHIYHFLLFVIRRECVSYFGKPKNAFYRKMIMLEDYDNYQNYMLAYDSKGALEHLKNQASEQQAFDRVKSVLPLLNTERRQLIALCLKYGFRYKAISQVMGTSTMDISYQVKKAIRDIKTILQQGGFATIEEKPTTVVKIQGVMTEEQKRILELRCQMKQSFVVIANTLNLSQKEVHKAFITAYKLMQETPQAQWS
jgi:RNA polymerase sigma factor (sigma-70 family)